VNAERTLRTKVLEWTKRYLPCELAGWAGELGAGAAAYWWTGSLAVAVVAGTLGASIGYYATAYGNSLRWAYRAMAGTAQLRRVVVANVRAARGIAIEFGPAEAIDSIAVRPLALYVGPFVFGSVAVGWIVGSLVADLAFYLLAIVSYERFTSLLVVRTAAKRPNDYEEVPGGSGAAISAA
jgi:hypothetical protein